MKFRKKPVEIEAFEFKWSVPAFPVWFTDAMAKSQAGIAVDPDTGKFLHAWIGTLEGVMTAQRGDWIIKGIKGEIYPCKPDIFEATYEAVT